MYGASSLELESLLALKYIDDLLGRGHGKVVNIDTNIFVDITIGEYPNVELGFS
jgi:hypothetical protein